MPIVTELNIYPVKSTRGIALSEAVVEPRGLRWDRRWMLVDNEGLFITARKWPRLAMVATHLQNDQLLIEAPGRDPLSISLADDRSSDREVTIWRDRCPVHEVSAAANDWFSAWLGTECRLVRLSDQDIRPVDPRYARSGDQVSLADGYPLLVIGEASLIDLNRRLDEPVEMRRFRPNLVIGTEEPFIEDQWRRIQVGDLELELVKGCSRCVFTTVDPDKGEKHPRQEPLRTLGTYRRKDDSGVFFGQNAVPRSLGTLHVGDEVEILE
jgi:uncharacterized protein YcbX